jgi:hypothetical protein
VGGTGWYRPELMHDISDSPDRSHVTPVVSPAAWIGEARSSTAVASDYMAMAGMIFGRVPKLDDVRKQITAREGSLRSLDRGYRDPG